MYLIITVDTESDNQWDITHGQTTENARFIPRFQELCEHYGFKPVYLTDYSMSGDAFLVNYLKKKSIENCCEIGMHLHAWNTPPRCVIDKSVSGRPYITEYTCEIMRKKVSSITERLNESFETEILSHRSGRWAINPEYISVLLSYGYKVDCSVTPGIDWSRQKGAIYSGANYTYEQQFSQNLYGTDMMEVGMTVKKLHVFEYNQKGILSKGKQFLKYVLGRNIWLRPALFSNYEMINLIDEIQKTGIDYVEFMLHSSELMPGGSPYFPSAESVEHLYVKLDEFFKTLSSRGYTGITLANYYLRHTLSGGY